MENIDITQLIEAEQARRHAADEAHVRQLARQQRADLGRWCATRRTVVRSVAMVVLLAVPGIYAMLLPQREPDMVLCNIPDDKPLVVTRACSALGNCGDRQVINMMNM